MKYILVLVFAVCTAPLFSQNVGIGTNNPLSKLHVAGAIRSDTLVYIGPGVRSLFAAPNGRIYDSLAVPAALSWEINGNSNITPTKFLGTTNAQDVIFKTNNVEAGRILGSNGYVGLGSTAPTSRLEVGAIGGDGITIKATSGTDAGDLMFFDAAGVEKGRVYTSPLATSGLVLSGGSTPGAHVFINNVGNVGIGNSAPNTRVEITSATANTSGLRFTNLTSASTTVASTGKALSVNATGDVILVPSSANDWQLTGNAGTTAGTNFLGTTDAQALVFKTNSTEWARILATGNTGIGTPSPLEKLHVNGNILANDGVYAQSSFSVGYSTATVISDIFQPWTDNGIKIYDGNSLSHIHMEALSYGSIQFYGTSGSPKAALENTAYAPLALQDKGGDVGIGTTAPGNRLEIRSATANTSGLRFTNLTAASPTVASTGKALSVDVNGDVVLIPAAGNDWLLTGNAGTTAGTNFLGTTDAQDMVFKTNNTEKVRITTSGQVGVGTSAPSASAVMQIVSTTQGVMFPTMSTAQRQAIAAPATGLMVYDATANILMSYNGTRWQEVGGDPIGSIEAFHKSMPATPTLPWGWVECNGQVLADPESPYNGQTMPSLNATGKFLRGSTVSGTMQTEDVGTHTHTGTTAAAGSHDHGGSTGSVNSTNGRVVPWDDNLSQDKMDAPNTAQLISTPAGGGGIPWDGLATVGNFLTTIDQLDHTHAISTDGNHTHTFTTNNNTGVETRPTNMSVIWIIRVK